MLAKISSSFFHFTFISTLEVAVKNFKRMLLVYYFSQHSRRKIVNNDRPSNWMQTQTYIPKYFSIKQNRSSKQSSWVLFNKTGRCSISGQYLALAVIAANSSHSYVNLQFWCKTRFLIF